MQIYSKKHPLRFHKKLFKGYLKKDLSYRDEIFRTNSVHFPAGIRRCFDVEIWLKIG